MDFETLLQNQYGDKEASALLSALEEERTHSLVLNDKKIKDQDFEATYPNVRKHPFVPHAYYYDPKEYDFGKSFLYDVGAFSIQDASAMMVPYLLDPQKEDVILDFCAAPGGKSVLLSLLKDDQGLIVSNDLSYPRAKILSAAIERMGRGNVLACANDFSLIYKNYRETFDKILLDAPCSGTAMFRKNEQAKKEWSIAKSLKFSLVQKELLDEAAYMLKPGGVIAYSTCSFMKEENEDVVLSFLEKHPDFHVLKASIDDPSFYHSPVLKEGIHFLPNRFEGEGQYICLLKKNGSIERSTSPSFRVEKKYLPFLKEYGLENRETLLLHDSLYSATLPFPVSKLNVLRYGVKAIDDLKLMIPDHALARYLDPSYSLSLNEKETRAYVRGETFQIDAEDGFHVVSHQGLTLGWIKAVKGIAKNHYPKGLRHDYLVLNSSL